MHSPSTSTIDMLRDRYVRAAIFYEDECKEGTCSSDSSDITCTQGQGSVGMCGENKSGGGHF
jgi:hypothetical protein